MRENFIPFVFLIMENLMTYYNNFFILRGLPGSGKSTLAKEIMKEYKNNCYLSTDEYLQAGNTYFWDKDLLYLAHKRCKVLFDHALLNNVETILLDNTNINWKAYKDYVELANLFSYNVKIFNIYDNGLTDQELKDRCSHNVSLTTYERMRKRYQQRDFYSQKEYNEYLSPDSSVVRALAL